VRQLNISAADARNNFRSLRDAIERAYGGVISRSDIDDATAAGMAKIVPRRLRIPEPSGEIASAFQAPYVVDADVQFRRYLDKCCAAYRDHRDKYALPSVVLTQSSGFGKSRVVFNLAIATAAEASEARGTDHDGVVCVRTHDQVVVGVSCRHLGTERDLFRSNGLEWAAYRAAPCSVRVREEASRHGRRGVVASLHDEERRF